MQESLGHKLRLMRAERGLSLREAARQAGVVKETISDIERGHTHPYDVTLAKLAKVYDVPLEELLQEPARAGIAEAPKEAGPLVNEDRPPASELASDTNFEQGRETAARGAALERYKSLRPRLVDIEELGWHEQSAVLDESMQLFKDLLLSDLDDVLTDSERREQNLVMDVLQQTIRHILALWELGQERGEVGADATNIEEAKADVTDIEEYRRARSRRSA